MLFVLTGSSCSGKTTLARACADLTNTVVHDFDEAGVPSAADQRWRQRTLEQWVRRALCYQHDGLDTLLTGQSPLGELLACPSAPQLDAIAVALIDVADRQRRRRLEQRDPGKWSAAAKRRFVSWARWHRIHAVDPQARPQVLIDGSWQHMRWDVWAAWTKDDPRWCTFVVDTTDRRPAESALQIGAWIAAARRDLTGGRLPLARGWSERP